jgi:DNA repair exonuclease SbcCD nuclease subunit
MIDVTTHVYTDAGYTTASENYSIESNVYNVIQQWNHAAGLGGGLDVNYEKVRRIVQEELGKLVIPEPIVPRDITPELLGIERRLKESVGAIKIPEQKEVDLEPVKQEVRSSVDNAINTLLLAVDAKEVTPATDLTELEAEVALRGTELNALATELRALRERLDTVLAQKAEQDDSVSKARDTALEFVNTLSGRKREEEPDPEELRRARARKLMGV